MLILLALDHERPPAEARGGLRRSTPFAAGFWRQTADANEQALPNGCLLIVGTHFPEDCEILVNPLLIRPQVDLIRFGLPLSNCL